MEQRENTEDGNAMINALVKSHNTIEPGSVDINECLDAASEGGKVGLVLRQRKSTISAASSVWKLCSFLEAKAATKRKISAIINGIGDCFRLHTVPLRLLSSQVGGLVADSSGFGGKEKQRTTKTERYSNEKPEQQGRKTIEINMFVCIGEYLTPTVIVPIRKRTEVAWR
ncbi:hypothetical protein OS493_010006 [Desmophyllum pertusum]|uniref:Uncharacterized protein n=1 Tax=Desmophyllum pertusum TaxID=174260 RepID=A0A9W9YG11_9CNID|nr:hypothetical protein OS493_010006 [Desmophyllum pertusum]